MDKNGESLNKESMKELARGIRDLDEQISRLNAQVTELKSEREKHSDDLVNLMGTLFGAEHGEGIRMDGVGFIKIETKAYPKIINFQGFEEWVDKEGQTPPPFTVNPSTFQAWYKEQLSNGLPLPPEESVHVFWKSRAKVNK